MLASITRRLKGRSPVQIVQRVAHTIANFRREMTEPNGLGQFRRSGRWAAGGSVDNLVLRNPAVLAR